MQPNSPTFKNPQPVVGQTMSFAMGKWFFVAMMFTFFCHGAGASPDATRDTFRAEFQNMQVAFVNQRRSGTPPPIELNALILR
jgi:hypothetical protein